MRGPGSQNRSFRLNQAVTLAGESELFPSIPSLIRRELEGKR